MIEVTDAERLGWQRRAALALIDILKEAAGLPLMRWEVQPRAVLVARPEGLVGEELIKTAWQRWITYYKLAGRQSESNQGQKIHLRAEMERELPSGMVTVVFLAEYWKDR